MRNGLNEGIKVARASSRGLMTPPLYLMIPFVLSGVLISLRNGGAPNIVETLLFSVSVIIIAAATNLFDDFFDVRNGIDAPGAPNTKYRKHPVFDMSLKPEKLLEYGILLITALAIILIVISVSIHNLLILLILPLGALISYGYTGDPFRLKYRGLGEAAVSISFIALSLIEIYSTSGTLGSGSVLLILQGSLAFPTVIFSGNIRDYTWDRDSGIRTVATVAGTAGSMLILRLMWVISTAFGVIFIISLGRPLLLFLLIPLLLTMFIAIYLTAIKDLTRIETVIGTCAFASVMISLIGLVLI